MSTASRDRRAPVLPVAPGGYDVMPDRPVRHLWPADHVTLPLTCRRTAPIIVRAPVEPAGRRPHGGRHGG